MAIVNVWLQHVVPVTGLMSLLRGINWSWLKASDLKSVNTVEHCRMDARHEENWPAEVSFDRSGPTILLA